MSQLSAVRVFTSAAADLPVSCCAVPASLQELGLLQPWCPGVAASVAMQRTMSVYSCQHDAIRADTAQQPSAAAAGAAAANPNSSSSGGVVGDEVLGMMGASFGAMWGAVGPAGMAPFVADRLQWRPLAAGMAAQMKDDLPQVREGGGGSWAMCGHAYSSVPAKMLPCNAASGLLSYTHKGTLAL
jgi:hypothetical protein